MTNLEPFAARQIRIAVSESASRDQNERADDVIHGSELTAYACECGQECGCFVSLTNDEYEDVRSVPTHSVAAPSHLVIGVEVVVRETPRYWVVEKIGAAAPVAVKLDPRAKTVPEPRAA